LIIINQISKLNNKNMKELSIQKLEIVSGGRDCSDGEGAVAGALATGWVLGPIGWSIAIGIAGTYWMTQCGPSDY
jgi:hypothetical protein